MSASLSILSNLVGWGYFFCWSISFYPQVWTNYKLGHVSGYSAEFNSLNILGFLSYLAYCLWGYFDPKIIPGVVDIQDIAFAGNAFLVSMLVSFQCLYYDPRFLHNMRSWVKIFLAVSLPFSIFLCTLEIFGSLPRVWEGFNACLWLGYLKLGITLTKYVPQAVRNYERKSTVGWSIETVLLDISGGVLSILQIFIDSVNTEEADSDGSFNITKFSLALISIGFDLIFIVQHYLLYKDPSLPNEPLLRKPRCLSKADSDISIKSDLTLIT